VPTPEGVKITLPVEDALPAAAYVELAGWPNDAGTTRSWPRAYRHGSGQLRGRQLSSAGFRATMKAPSPVPVLLAAMNPAMLRLAGRAADGVFITWTPPGEVASRLAHVRDGERAAGGADPRDGAGRRGRVPRHHHRPGQGPRT
jgi:luciferase-like monooxygenase